MSGRSETLETVTESCPDCGRDTQHAVRIELRTESRKRENAEFSREPYRVVTCRFCGRESSIRMNNA